MTESRFAGRTAIVTGAASGIGRATALRLASEGAVVVAVDLNAAGLDALVAEATGPAMIPVAVNLAEKTAIDTIVAALPGPVDALINNAGIMDGFLPIAEVDDDTWDRVMTVNVTAMMRLIRAVIPGMVDAGRGSIVNISSEAGLRGSCSGVAYATSKHAVNGLTRSTAVVYGPSGVRCNAVAPGGVNTGIDAPFKSEFAVGVLGPMMGTTAGRTAEPTELAATICWLASDEASNVNGVVLPCDGGWSAR